LAETLEGPQTPGGTGTAAIMSQKSLFSGLPAAELSID
jgi:hypothetical protein